MAIGPPKWCVTLSLATMLVLRKQWGHCGLFQGCTSVGEGCWQKFGFMLEQAWAVSSVGE